MGSLYHSPFDFASLPEESCRILDIHTEHPGAVSRFLGECVYNTHTSVSHIRAYSSCFCILSSAFFPEGYRFVIAERITETIVSSRGRPPVPLHSSPVTASPNPLGRFALAAAGPSGRPAPTRWNDTERYPKAERFLTTFVTTWVRALPGGGPPPTGFARNGPCSDIPRRG